MINIKNAFYNYLIILLMSYISLRKIALTKKIEDNIIKRIKNYAKSSDIILKLHYKDEDEENLIFKI